MACGVTKTLNSQTVTCDNAGVSTHTGLHSGVLTYSTTVFGITINWSSTRVYWGGNTTPATAVFAKQKVAVLGQSDFV